MPYRSDHAIRHCGARFEFLRDSSTRRQPLATAADNAITPDAAHAIAVNAYLYFYPLVTMDITRKQSVNVEPGRVWQRPDEHVRQRPLVSVRRYEELVVRVEFPAPSIPSRGSISPRSRKLFPHRTPEGGFTSCRCSTCGRMCLHHPAGARPERRRTISLSLRPVGAALFQTGLRKSPRRLLMSGSSAAPKLWPGRLRGGA